MANSVFTPEQEARINDLLIEYLSQNGASIDAGVNVVELTGDALTDENLKKLTIPSILPNTNQWAYTSLQNMMTPILNAIIQLQTQDQQVQTTISNASTATQAANTAAGNANTRATEAERVNAQVQGTTVTVTNRNGQSTSVNIGFEIYRTYVSVEAMKLDAYNVAEGKFVIIASTDPTSAENARLYVRNSLPATATEPFDLMCDLDQASAAAWADWLENMKPQIEGATDAANAAASRVDSVIATANQDHTQAGSDHNLSVTATNNANTAASFAQEQGNYAKEWNDHPPYIADGTTEHRGDPYYMYLWDISTHAYVRGAYVKGADLDYNTMTQEEYERLVENVKSSILFSSVQTCEDIINELV